MRGMPAWPVFFDGKTMKKTWMCAAGMLVSLHAAAAGLRIDQFDHDKLNIQGGQCAFEDAGHRNVLSTDWVEVYWLKVDGKMVKLTGTQTDDVIEQQQKAKIWRQTVTGSGLTLVIDLKETGEGDDAKGYQGTIEVRRGADRKRIAVTAECGA